MDDELIEKVAIACFGSAKYWPATDAVTKRQYCEMARAAIQAMKEAGYIHPSKIMVTVTVTGAGGDSDGNTFSSKVSTFPLVWEKP